LCYLFTEFIQVVHEFLCRDFDHLHKSNFITGLKLLWELWERNRFTAGYEHFVVNFIMAK
jgi:hypothetical protein